MSSEKTIYVLLCEENKYYVGSTTNLDKRLQDHYLNLGSEWTKKFSPIQLIEQFQTNDPLAEDQTTKKYMLRHGIENVRGGSYCQLNFSYREISTLNKEFNSARNQCFKCGQVGHYFKNCGKIPNETTSERIICNRCGRNTHLEDKCFAHTHLNGSNLSLNIKITPRLYKRPKKIEIQPLDLELKDCIDENKNNEIITEDSKDSPQSSPIDIDMTLEDEKSKENENPRSVIIRTIYYDMKTKESHPNIVRVTLNNDPLCIYIDISYSKDMPPETILKQLLAKYKDLEAIDSDFSIRITSSRGGTTEGGDSATKDEGIITNFYNIFNYVTKLWG